MAIIEKHEKTWVCDCCGKQVVSDHKPNKPSENWSYITIDQDAGFDGSGVPWCPRLRHPLTLCGECTELVVSALNTKHAEVCK